MFGILPHLPQKPKDQRARRIQLYTGFLVGASGFGFLFCPLALEPRQMALFFKNVGISAGSVDDPSYFWIGMSFHVVGLLLIVAGGMILPSSRLEFPHLNADGLKSQPEESVEDEN